MIPIIAAGLAVACAALLTTTAAGLVEADPPHPGFGDLPPDGRSLTTLPIAVPEPGEQLPAPSTGTYFHVITPGELVAEPAPAGRHRAPEPLGYVPAHLATYPAWVAAGCPVPARPTTPPALCERPDR